MFDFPANPGIQEEYTSGGIRWIWDGVAWRNADRGDFELYQTSFCYTNADGSIRASYGILGVTNVGTGIRDQTCEVFRADLPTYNNILGTSAQGSTGFGHINLSGTRYPGGNVYRVATRNGSPGTPQNMLQSTTHIINGAYP